MEIEERLSALGLTKTTFAAKLGVVASSVSNMVAKGQLTQKAEDLLRELEGSPAGHIKPGNLVRTEGETFRVIRRDHCINLKGSETWVYWISRAHQEVDGWSYTGPSTRCPEAFLTDLGEVQWRSEEREDRTKQGKGK